MPLRMPPLRDVHDERGAKFTEFGGWDMPVEFDSIREEHAAIRESVGKFDVSHMGEIEVAGPDATPLMQRLTSNDVTALGVGDAQYSTIPNEDGDIVDDTVVYRRPDEDGDPAYLFVPNAGNDRSIHERWVDHRDRWEMDAAVTNRTEDLAMFAVQGPDAVDLVDGAAAEPVSDLSKFSARYVDVAGVEAWVARTGYTGEDGVELIVPWDDADRVWEAFDCQPCGLGARDTLRLEAGLLLSGQDFDVEDDPRNPYEAGIPFTVKLDTEFVGRDALQRVSEEGVDEKLVGLRLIDRGIARHGHDVTDTDGHVIGTVTSGTMSPTLEDPIALAYVPAEYADEGTSVRVMVRGESKTARVESLPFLEDRQ